MTKFKSIGGKYFYNQFGKSVKYENYFKADKNGCFTKSQAEKFVKDCNKSSNIQNSVIFIY
jgi:hypothetical protein